MFGIFENTLLGITLAVPPGPVGIEATRRGITHGFRASFNLWLGAATGDTAALLIVLYGFSKIMSHPFIELATWLFGFSMLTWMGYQSIRNGLHKKFLTPDSQGSKRNAFLLGFFLAWANPVSIGFWIGIFGPFMAASGEVQVTLATLIRSLFIIVGVLIWSLILSALSSCGKNILTGKVMNRLSIGAGCGLLGFASLYGYKAALTAYLLLSHLL
ncbi:MAG: LysE family translocator [Chlamydiota bacterium]